MERNVIIILILNSVFKSGLGFSSGDWFEIDGCHSLGAAIIQNQTNLTENEPGSCLEWCGTKRVALQNSSCFCFDDTQHLNWTREDSCDQNCSGKEEIFKCGGKTSSIVSIYTERRDISAELGPSNGSRCLTYHYIPGELNGKLEPVTCTKHHLFYCYSEIKYGLLECHRYADIHDNRTWYEALEACRSRVLQFLWPAQDRRICSEKIAQEEWYWVAVYQWTKVVPTSTTTSTVTTTTTSIPSTSTTTTATSTPSTTLPTTTITTSVSSTISSTSTTSSSSTAASSTTIPPDIPTTDLASSSSISALTSSSTSTKSTSPTQLSTSLNDTTESPRHEAAVFQIDPPNIGIGVGIGLLAGIVISITINYVWRKIKGHTSGVMSRVPRTFQEIQHDEGTQRDQNQTFAFSNGTVYTSNSQLTTEEHVDIRM